MIKDIRPGNKMIEKMPMRSNLIFPLRIVLDMKGNTNTRVAFKAESKEVDKHSNKKENDSADFQDAFQQFRMSLGHGISDLDM